MEIQNQEFEIEVERIIKTFESIEHEEKHEIIKSLKEGGIFAKQGNFDLAEQAFKRALEFRQYGNQTSLAFTFYNLARIKYNQGNFVAAERLLKNATKLRRDDVNNWLLLGDVYRKLEKSVEAIRAFRTASTKKSKVDYASLQLGKLFRENGNLREAFIELKKIKTITKQVVEEFEYFASQAIKDGESELAEESLKILADTAPSNTDLLIDLGKILFKQEKMKEAEKILLKAVKIDPKISTGWFLLGEIFQTQERFTESIQAFNNVIKEDHKDVRAWMNLGEIYYSQSMFDEAKKAFKEILEIQPNNIEAWIKLGEIFTAKEEFKEAEEAYLKVVKYNPNNVYIRVNLATLLKNQERLEEAEKIIREALEYNSSCAKCWSFLGKLLEQKGSFSEAIDAYWNAVEHNPQLMETWISLGFLLKKFERYYEAEKAFTEALDVAPPNWIKKETIERELTELIKEKQKTQPPIVKEAPVPVRTDEHVPITKMKKEETKELKEEKKEEAKTIFDLIETTYGDPIYYYDLVRERVIAIHNDGSASESVTEPTEEGGGKIFQRTLSKDDKILQSIAGIKQMPVKPSSSLAFLPNDSNTLISGRWDGMVEIWNIKTGEMVREINGHKMKVTAISITPDGENLITASDDNTIRIWNTQTGHQVLSKPCGHTGQVVCLDISNEGNIFVSGGAEGVVAVWDFEKGDRIFNLHELYLSNPLLAMTNQIQGRTNPVICLSISKDNIHLISGYSDGFVRLWNLRNAELVDSIKLMNESVMKVSFTKDNKWIVVLYRNGHISAFPFNQGGINHSHRKVISQQNQVKIFSTAHSNNYILYGTDNSSIHIYSFEKATKKLYEPLNIVTSISVSDDSKYIAAGGANGEIKIWDFQTYELIKDLVDYPIDTIPGSYDTIPGSFDTPSEDYEQYVHRGADFADQGNLNQAIECFQKATEINPNIPMAWTNISVIYGRMKKESEAISAAKTAIKIDPGTEQAWKVLAVSYREIGKPYEAINAFKEAVKLNPNSEYWYEIGTIYGNLKNFPEAEKYLKKAVNLNPQLYQAWGNLGFAYEEMGDLKNAISCYQRSLKINSKSVVALNGLATVYLSLNNLKLALNYGIKATNENPNSDESWTHLGVIYRHLKDNERAIQAYEKALSIKDRPDTWFSLGNAYFDEKNIKKSLDCYKKAVKFKPDYDKAWENMGYTYDSIGKWKDAIKYYKKTLEINPRKYSAWINMGVTYGKKRKHKDALECFQNALKFNPNDGLIWMNMAQTYGHLGNKVKAQECAMKALLLAAEQAKRR